VSVKTEPQPKSPRKKSGTVSVMPTDPIQRTMILCATYTRKLRAIRKQILLIRKSAGSAFEFALINAFKNTLENEHHKLNRLNKLSRPLIHAAEDLARFASGMIENSDLEQLDRIEMRLRSAELESVLIELKELIAS
jgi:hypothetical protein